MKIPKFGWPAVGTPQLHILLILVSMLILGPLAAVTALYMNFSIGFAIGAQIFASILGSVVTYRYGPEGMHMGNYIQTLAASVASVTGMGILIQVRVWYGLPTPIMPLILFHACISLFGIGVGMAYTPLLVDKMDLKFPSGLGAANILRALCNKLLLNKSLAKLATGTGLGYAMGIASMKLTALEPLGLSASTIGVGMILGVTLTLPAFLLGLTGEQLVPYLVKIEWLEPGDPFRKVFFIIMLGMILGAFIAQLLGIIHKLVTRKVKETTSIIGLEILRQEDKQKIKSSFLALWILGSAVAVIVVGHFFLYQPIAYLALALALSAIFLLVNGLSLGMTDSNPVSSATVFAIYVMAMTKLTNVDTALLCASIMLLNMSIGGDMQQDRSTGKRLSTPRRTQFWYQVMGIPMAAALSVLLPLFFMKAYPILQKDQTVMKKEERPTAWQSAMTYKLKGAIDTFIVPIDQNAPPAKLAKIMQKREVAKKAVLLGLAIGFVTQLLRELLALSQRYRRYLKRGTRSSKFVRFMIDAIILPSPYASSFGGFVELSTSLWYMIGGVLASYSRFIESEARAEATAESRSKLPDEKDACHTCQGSGIKTNVISAGYSAEPLHVESTTTPRPTSSNIDEPDSANEGLDDMSTSPLIGGGIIAGEALGILTIGIYGLLHVL